MRTLAPLLLAALLVPSAALASDAEACIQTKVWSQYDDSYALRHLATMKMGLGDTSKGPVTLIPGQTYRFVACADEGTKRLDLVLYDAEGKAVKASRDAGREPSVEVSVTEVGTYFLAFRVVETTSPDVTSEVAIALIYK